MGTVPWEADDESDRMIKLLSYGLRLNGNTACPGAQTSAGAARDTVSNLPGVSNSPGQFLQENTGSEACVVSHFFARLADNAMKMAGRDQDLFLRRSEAGRGLFAGQTGGLAEHYPGCCFLLAEDFLRTSSASSRRRWSSGL